MILCQIFMTDLEYCVAYTLQYRRSILLRVHKFCSLVFNSNQIIDYTVYTHEQPLLIWVYGLMQATQKSGWEIFPRLLQRWTDLGIIVQLKTSLGGVIWFDLFHNYSFIMNKLSHQIKFEWYV